MKTSPLFNGFDSSVPPMHRGLVDDAMSAPVVARPELVMNTSGRTVEHALVDAIKRSERFAFSVAFVTSSGLAQLKQHLLDFRGSGQIITSDFLGFNRPEVFEELLKLRELRGIEVFRHRSRAFHPKGYVFWRDQSLTALVGSSNLTSQAMSKNYEWNLKVVAPIESELSLEFEAALEEQLADSEPITAAWIEQYAADFREPVERREDAPGAIIQTAAVVAPNAMQHEALLALETTRSEGADRAIIISATGTGKTMLSALDVRAVRPSRMLFVVHREQILDRTIDEFHRVLGGPSSDFGKLTGSRKDFDSRYVFATVQTLSQPDILERFSPDTFDYVIVDEAHRAIAETYRRLLNYFQPKFLLGMTATPERSDGFNVFELFGFNVPYEIRLNSALEAEMLAPFHYYGVADIQFDDGTTTSDATELRRLVSSERVAHIVAALDTYGQAGIPPRGLIFCSRKDEARELADDLNRSDFRARKLRTVALTGEDSISVREEAVAALERGDLDYILTVDVFNEGIDIPTINQVVMLRQTQSPIVFVQQLGRGLRLAEGKQYLVVIDFIGNYNNNFMIPIALFGDESLNRETLRERLNETVESGSMPGLSSVSFDEISRERVMRSIATTKLDSLTNLKSALVGMRNRVGQAPALYDFYRFKSVDPVLLATKGAHYPDLLEKLLGEKHGLSYSEQKALELLSHEVLGGRRLHEILLIEELLRARRLEVTALPGLLASGGLLVSNAILGTVLDTFTLGGYSEAAKAKYQSALVSLDNGEVALTEPFASSFDTSPSFARAVNDLIRTAKQLIGTRYRPDVLFTPGLQYSRQDAAHILGWPRKVSSTIYGVKTDTTLGVCAIFVTLEKSDEVTASTAYQDRLLDRSTMRWFTKSNRRLTSKDVEPIVGNSVELHVFVKKDDAEGSSHYYLGQATAAEALETSMSGAEGVQLPVVTMLLRFREQISQGLFDYFAPAPPGL